MDHNVLYNQTIRTIRIFKKSGCYEPVKKPLFLDFQAKDWEFALRSLVVCARSVFLSKLSGAFQVIIDFRPFSRINGGVSTVE